MPERNNIERKTVVLLQSNYLPWKGYFDLIKAADVCIFHDDLQYTKQDWRNRNRIKTPAGVRWLTIPCGATENRTIAQVTLRDDAWQVDHWRRICASYDQAPWFSHYADFFEDFYLGHRWDNLSELNQYLIRHICREYLHIQTPFEDSGRYQLVERKAERVMELLAKVGATGYVSGPAAKSYLDEGQFAQRGISLTWMGYAGYPEYDQLHPPFEHNVSIIDLLVHTGQAAPHFISQGA